MCTYILQMLHSETLIVLKKYYFKNFLFCIVLWLINNISQCFKKQLLKSSVFQGYFIL